MSIPIHYLQYLSLVTLTVQNAVLALSMRYARTRPGHMFISSTAVLNSEIVKLITCLVLVYREYNNVPKWLEEMKKIVFDNPIDTLKVCVPSFVYVLQNNLLYVAASHLDAGTYQVTYQLKILTTAIFSVIILKRKLLFTQWLALVILLLGVVAVELAKTEESPPSSSHNADSLQQPIDPSEPVSEAVEQNKVIGIMAAVGACVFSGFAGIYFEKILKGSTISLWMRNVQLSLCSIPFALFTCFINDREALINKGFFYGYDGFVIYLVILQACGGLLVAIVVKYADNLLKGFATSVAIIISCVVSIILFDFQLTVQFAFGTVLVMGSIFLYGYTPKSQTKKSASTIAKVI